jgi:hypothetical protein
LYREARGGARRVGDAMLGRKGGRKQGGGGEEAGRGNGRGSAGVSPAAAPKGRRAVTLLGSEAVL